MCDSASVVPINEVICVVQTAFSLDGQQGSDAHAKGSQQNSGDNWVHRGCLNFSHYRHGSGRFQTSSGQSANRPLAAPILNNKST